MTKISLNLRNISIAIIDFLITFFREKLEIALQEKENFESNCRQLNISHNLLKNELNELNSLKERFV
jgi:hypothetical protein